MNDKQHNTSELVEQDEALGFYFDSLLLTDDIEYLDDIQAPEDVSGAVAQPLEPAVEQTTAQVQEEAPETEQQKLNTARAFLQASRERRQQQENSQEASLKPGSEPTPAPKAETTPVVQRQAHAEPDPDAHTIVAKTITPGPVSPKPREYSRKAVTQSSNQAEAEPVIVFTEKDKDGNVKEEVLIPRSQRLAQNKPAINRESSRQAGPNNRQKYANAKENLQKSRPQSIPASGNILDSSEPVEHNRVQEKVSPASEPVTKPSALSAREPQKKPLKEAPELDISLFLPKIKTLSDEEIKQQLEALTQAVVSQTQVEAELQELSQYEKYKQQTQQGDSEALIQNINNAPDWAIPEFQVLLFAVSGLKLAIPLAELNGILEWGDEYINELPGHASWYLGLINHLGQNVPVIDTLQQVVPKERWPAGHLEKPGFKHIILIDNGRWGLACEQVLEIITLKTESVKWRSSRTKRRWLLGTVIDQMCALLDSSEFASMLETGKDSLIGAQ